MRILAWIVVATVVASPLTAFGQEGEEPAPWAPRPRPWRDGTSKSDPQPALPVAGDGYRTMGITGVAVGGGLVLLGTVAIVYAEAIWKDPCTGDQGHCYNTSWLFAKRSLSILGVATILEGVVFGAILGGIGFSRSVAERAPLTTRTSPANGPRLRLVALGIAPVPGGGVMGATLVF